MDSDDSYETTSEVSPDRETRFSSSSSHESVNRNSTEIRDLYLSVFSGAEPSAPSLKNQLDTLRAKVQECERTKLLEQKIQLYHSLEKKECELVDFMQSYEQKAKDIAQYMQKVQGLLAQLTDFFPEHFEEKPIEFDVDKSAAGGEVTSGQIDSKLHKPNGTFPSECKLRGERGRDILRALTASVAAASASNRQSAINRSSEHKTTHPGSVEQVKNTSEYSKINGHTTTDKECSNPSAIDGDDVSEVSDPRELPPHLPPFCWSAEQVLVWLSEYACLPSGCLEAAKQCHLDGKQLTTLSEIEATKFLRLTDAGLRRKLHLALEDLRVHGSPGVSRFPGPSHIRPEWVCNTWLRCHLGLTHLAPFFSIRRVDGRMLASLAVCGISKPSNQKHLTKGNTEVRLISSPRGPVGGDGSLPSLGPTNISGEHGRGASRKEFCRILLGINFDKSSEKAQSEGLSGADLPPAAKHLFGKNEVRSLRAGLELLRRFNFDIELLERTRECGNRLDSLLLWTNEDIAKWLDTFGLRAYTHGINNTGLHGAYMVLDPTFNVNRLVKQLRLPQTMVSNYNLDARLQELLKPARLLEGIVSKPRSLFRRRSASRSTHPSIMQRSATSISNLELCESTSPESGDPLSEVARSTNHSNLTVPAKSELLNLSRKTGWLSKNKCVQTGSVEISRKQWTNSLKKLPVLDVNEKQMALNNVPDSGLHNRRIARLFQLNRSAVIEPSMEKNPSSGIRSTNSPATNTSFEEEDRSATLVRRTSSSSSTDVIKSPRTRKTNGNKSPSPTNQGGVVKASDALMIDPFDQSVGQVRARILLFQTTQTSNSDSLVRSPTSKTHTSTRTNRSMLPGPQQHQQHVVHSELDTALAPSTNQIGQPSLESQASSTVSSLSRSSYEETCVLSNRLS
ncbi:hypothetical protein T265_01347 [Opisthorchis viverrini]|uniref:SAM domain-containing protein n=1 Tax=Opisthorchis viverrini TaxID=6198 RepID=A0A075A367_OPIVI|nr:hypothetical protein T265_01347 [Opisthorchis viverrini]KER32662.1 hypothetical protein T265_01347 [Opisthorchis viverrini]